MKYFLGILVFFLAFGWLVLLFSAIGLFYTGTIVLSILISFIFAFYLVSLRGSVATAAIPANTENTGLLRYARNDKHKKIFCLVIIISLAASFATCYFATPTVFGGRDQGSIATAAIELSKNHGLKIQNPAAEDLFQKYGPGHALNFPGFDYTKNGTLISRFPLGFTSYLASAYTLFGLKGIQYANFIPLFLFLAIFWLILRQFFDEKISFLGFLLAATFFPFLWFAKFTLTEIYMLFLVWAGIYFLLRTGSFYISLSFFALASLTRIEGMIFFILAATYIFVREQKSASPKAKNLGKSLLVTTLILAAIYAYLNFPDLVDSSKNFVKIFLPNSGKESAPSAGLYSYLIRVFFSYNIFAYIILGLAGIVWLAVRIRKNWLKPEFLPIFITFPAFLYLLSPMITLDDPWLLRRFVFAIFPALIFYSIYFLHKFFYHKIFLYITLAVLIAANAVVSARFFTLSENKNLLPQIEKISQKFGSDDLALVDRLSAGNGYALMSEPLRTIFDKNAVYFFNAADLDYINQDRYKNVYLVAPVFAENPWYSNLVKDKAPVEGQVVTNNFLEPSDKKWGLAQNVESQDLVGIWKIK